MTATDDAYAAGFFASAARTHGKTFTFKTTDKDLAEFLSPYTEMKPSPKRSKSNRILYVWQPTEEEQIAFFKRVGKYMKGKMRARAWHYLLDHDVSPNFRIETRS
jgi:hypothetical protein